MTLGKAAQIFDHYIRLALEMAGEEITSDMSAELSDAVQAFRDAEDRLKPSPQ